MEDFVILPRSIRKSYIDRRLTRNQHDILVWIFECTNPFDGRYEASYKGLVEDFRSSISQENMRRILSDLRRHEWIWFRDHRGKGGKFTIYPLNFQLSNRHIQCIEDFEITTSHSFHTQSNEQPIAQRDHNLDGQNHNRKDQELVEAKTVLGSTEHIEITTSYNQNDNENNNEIMQTAFAGKINELINSFRGINPNIERLYANKTQRAALERLLQKFPLDQLNKMILALPKIVVQPYAPKITTPLQLENDMAKLLIFLKQEENKKRQKTLHITSI